MSIPPIVESLRRALAENQILTDRDSLVRYGRDWIKDYEPNPAVIALPRTVEQVQEIVRICIEKRHALVPSGGRTGLSGGATAINGEVILSLERLDKIFGVDVADRVLRCQAGAITQKIQEAAAKHDLFFPIDFASKGSSQIGGNIATNAGGIQVIRYGNTREWILNLQVVLGTGELLDLGQSLVKNQTGYDLRSLFVGSEGTLGVITGATLKLTTPPQNRTRILCSFASLDRLLEVFVTVRNRFEKLTIFEYFDMKSMECVLQHHSLRRPFPAPQPHYALIEIDVPDTERIEEVFSQLLENEDVTEVVVSSSMQQSDELLKYRELISETLSSQYTLHKNDISVPVPRIVDFLKALEQLATKEYQNFQSVIFGHVGDGNIHLNILKTEKVPDETFFEICRDKDQVVFELVSKFHGSISAEHGVGLLKREYLHYTRSPTEIELMRAIKKAFDPHQIMNPGKIFQLN